MTSDQHAPSTGQEGGVNLFGHGGGAEAERDLSEWLDQQTLSTGQPEKRCRECGEDRENAEPWLHAECADEREANASAEVESLRQQLAGHENCADEIEQHVETIRQLEVRLAAAQAERQQVFRLGLHRVFDDLKAERDQLRERLSRYEDDEEIDPLTVVTLGDGSGFEGYYVCATCGEPIDPNKPDTYFGEPNAYFHKRPCHTSAGAFRLQLRAEHFERLYNDTLPHVRDRLRADHQQLVERYSQVASDLSAAKAQVEATAKECGLLKTENEALRGAMRETVSCARTVLSKLRLSDRPPYAELVALQNAVETAAALDAASTGQPKSNG